MVRALRSARPQLTWKRLILPQKKKFFFFSKRRKSSQFFGLRLALNASITHLEAPDFAFLEKFLSSSAKDAEAHSPLVRALRSARPQLTWKRLILPQKKKLFF
ncbi:MAG: hypothetical protein IJ547_05960, partial [Clostridia bacterium]|nr:hypothetical protein [Clostridia bacterium]